MMLCTGRLVRDGEHAGEGNRLIVVAGCGCRVSRDTVAGQATGAHLALEVGKRLLQAPVELVARLLQPLSPTRRVGQEVFWVVEQAEVEGLEL